MAKKKEKDFAVGQILTCVRSVGLYEHPFNPETRSLTTLRPGDVVLLLETHRETWDDEWGWGEGSLVGRILWDSKQFVAILTRGNLRWFEPI